MRLKFFSFLILFLLFLNIVLAQSDKSASKHNINRIKKLDVYVKEEKVYLSFKTDFIPDYELLGNLQRRVLTIKFRNATVKKMNTGLKFYNNLLQDGKIVWISDKEIWFLINTRNKNLQYRVLPNTEKLPELTIEFDYAPIPKNTVSAEEDKNIITGIIHTKNRLGERLELEFTEKPTVIYDVVTLPNFRANFVLENSLITKDTKFEPVFSELVKKIDYIRSDNFTSFSLIPLEGTLKIQISYRGSPERAIIDFQKSNIKDTATEFSDARNFIQETQNPSEQKLKTLYIRAEYLYRNGHWIDAKKMFEAVNIASPNSDLGIRALFRAADALNQNNIENPVSEGFTRVIDSYSLAITTAERQKKNLPEIERAYFNTGLNYLTGKFYDLGESYFRETMRRFPGSFYAENARFHLGILYRQDNRLNQSSRIFEQVIKSNNQSRNVDRSYYYLGENYYLSDDFEQAKHYFDRARNRDIGLFENDPNMLFAQAETYFEVGEQEKARSIYEQIVDNFPDFPKRNYIIIRLGDYQRDRGQENASLRMYELAINSPEIKFAIISRMRIANMIAPYPGKEFYQKVIDLYGMIIREFPDQSEAEEAMLRLASTYSIHGYYKKSLQTMDEFKVKHSKSEYITPERLSRLYVNNIVRLMEQKYRENSYSEVVANYKKYENILNATPKSIPYIFLFKSFQEIGDFDQANAVLYNATANFPEDKVSLAWYYLAKNYYDQEQYSEAIRIISDASSDKLKNYYTAKSQLLLGKSYAKQNLMPEAVKTLIQFLEKNKNSAEPIFFDFVTKAWFDLGEIYRKIGKYSLALNAYKKSIESYKHSIRDKGAFNFIRKAFYYAGDMNFELKEYGVAKQEYQKALSTYPNNDYAHWANYQIGYIYQLQENYAPALDIFNKLIDKAGADSDVLWAKLAQEGKQEIELKLKFKKYLEDPNALIGNDP